MNAYQQLPWRAFRVHWSPAYESAVDEKYWSLIQILIDPRDGEIPATVETYLPQILRSAPLIPVDVVLQNLPSDVEIQPLVLSASAYRP